MEKKTLKEIANELLDQMENEGITPDDDRDDDFSRAYWHLFNTVNCN